MLLRRREQSWSEKKKIGESILPVPVTASALIFSSIPVPVSVPALTPSPVPVSVPAPAPSPAPTSAIALSQVTVSPSFYSPPVLSVPSPMVQKEPISVDRLSRRLTKLPKNGIDRFDGNIRDWLLFIGDFNSAIGSVPDYDNNKKMSYLGFFLTKKVQNSIAPFLYDANDYPQTIAELERVNGHPHVIARSNVDSILNLPIMKDNTDSL